VRCSAGAFHYHLLTNHYSLITPTPAFALSSAQFSITIRALIMDKLLELLQANSRRSPTELANALGTTEADAQARVAAAEAAGVILGYQAVIDQTKLEDRPVIALIEVKVSPEHGGGFDRLAHRISQYDQVRDCYLMSGHYDLAVVVEGSNLFEVARFVSEKLSTLRGVLGTGTLFQLKSYKQAGFIVDSGEQEERLPVAP